MPNSLLIKNGIVVTCGTPNRVIEDGAILVEDEHILDAGTTLDLEERYSTKKKDVLDAAGRVVMPGLINSHTHLYSTMARGISLKSEPPANFLEILQRLWWQLDKALSPDDVYTSALVPLIECIKHGTTSIIDHHASPFACEGSLDRIEEAVSKTGIRTCLCYEVSDRDGPAIAEKGIKENIRWLRKVNDSKNPLLAGLFGLHASLTLSEKTLVKCKESSMDMNTGFHIHIAEDLIDQDDSLKKSGRTVVQRLNDYGILGERSVAAHCVHIDDEEIEILKSTGTRVVHNPQSNMNNAVGAADISKMLKKDILLGIGTDGMTSSMFEEARAAFLLNHHHSKDPSGGWQEIPRMLFTNNPRIAGNCFQTRLGVIERGAAADVIVVDYQPPTPLTSDNFFSHFLFGMTQSVVDTTIVNGTILMRNKEVLVVDEKEISTRSRQLSQKLWERFNG